MNKYLTAALCLVCVSLSVFLGIASYEVAKTAWTVRLAVNEISEHTIVQVDGLNLPRLSQDVGKAVVNIKDAAQVATITAQKEGKYLDTWNASLTKTLSNVDALTADLDRSQAAITASATSTLDATTVTIKGTQPLLTAATGSINESTKVQADIDAVINAPDLRANIANAAKITASGADILDTSDQVLQKATKPYLHPKPQNGLQKVWSETSPWLYMVGKIAAGLM